MAELPSGWDLDTEVRMNANQSLEWPSGSNCDGLIDAVVKARREEALDIISLELAAPDGAELPPFDAGAHVEFSLSGGLVRHYSLCNDPVERHRYLLGILREPKSRGGSAEIFRSVHAGDPVRIGRPRNNFPLTRFVARSVLLAAGIGITPLLAMAYQLQRDGSAFELHYRARSPARTAFTEVVSKATFADRVFYHFDDGGADQQLHLSQTLGGPNPGHHLYVCGPSRFITYVTEGAKALGWNTANIHVEYFSTEVDLRGETFTVTAARSGLTCRVPASRTIAEVLMEHGVKVPLSCEEGVCGTCLAPVIRGIPDHRDLVQTEKEKAANTYVAVCCSRSKSPDLVIDL